MHKIKDFAFGMSRGVVQLSRDIQVFIRENDLFLDVRQPKFTDRPDQEGKPSE